MGRFTMQKPVFVILILTALLQPNFAIKTPFEGILRGASSLHDSENDTSELKNSFGSGNSSRSSSMGILRDFSDDSSSFLNDRSGSSISESSNSSPRVISFADIVRGSTPAGSLSIPNNSISSSSPRKVPNIAATYIGSSHHRIDINSLKFFNGRSHSYTKLLMYYRPNYGPRPVFVGRCSQYNSGISEGLRCYTCIGKGNQKCTSMSLDTNNSFIKQSRCKPNQYCAVIRKEYPAYDPNQPEFEVSISEFLGSSLHQMTEEKCVSYAKEFHSKYEKETPQERTLFLEKVKAEGCEFRERPNNETVIQRACRSFSFDSMGRSPISASLKSKRSPVKIYTNSYCTTDLCNSGDGRLKCYACEGSGRDGSSLFTWEANGCSLKVFFKSEST